MSPRRNRHTRNSISGKLVFAALLVSALVLIVAADITAPNSVDAQVQSVNYAPANSGQDVSP